MPIRNIAIIAHVDHGKTTLVDGMLKQTHTFRDNQAEMNQTTILDRNELEREKGITILAKTTTVQFGDTKINIIDTPGHADFSGEVERVINMADGALLIVDAAEGPLPQTKFVLQKALDQHLKLIVVINKIDRGDARPDEVLRETEELFLQLASNEEDLAFPVVYAIGREGKAWDNYPEDFTQPGTLNPLFEEILRTVPEPQSDVNAPFKMLVSNLDFDPYKGTFTIGRIMQGTVKTGQMVAQVEHTKMVSQHRVQQVFTSMGLSRVEVPEAYAGDIIALTGIDPVHIGNTLTDLSDTQGLPVIRLGEPTLKIYLGPNTSPMAAKEGKFYTARQIEERLEREKKVNIGLRIETNPNGAGFLVAGRGELHLSILIENLRREGYELEVGKPEVIIKDIDGVSSEPFEEVEIEVEQEFMGAVIEELGRRRAELQSSQSNDRGTNKFTYIMSSRNLLGLRGVLLTRTRGTAIVNTQFLDFRPVGPVAESFRNGVIIALEQGQATSFALESLQERGQSLIEPGTAVYEGMVIGVNNRQEDMEMNIVKTKALTNHRSANADILTVLNRPLDLSLEQCLDFLGDDELLEATPENLRLRKRILNKVERNRQSRRS